MRVILLAFAFALCFSSCASGGNGEHSGEGNGKRPDGDAVKTSADYTYKIDISAIADALNTLDDAYMVLANKTFVIGADHVPSGLTALDAQYTGGKSISLAGNAAIAAEALIREMRAHGFSSVFITSGYRSYEYQETLFDRYCANEKAAHPGYSDEQIKEIVLSYSAYPGTSEHQTGLCVDLMNGEMAGLWNYGSETPDNPYDKGFAETKEFKWLADNAHKFGFILRYPEDKTDITGYSYESWHYRFVGIDAATYIHENDLTLEEYLGK